MKKALLATAAVVLLMSGSPVPAFAQGFTVNVIGVDPDNTETAITGYRWTLEEDLTYHVVPGVSDPNTLALRFHRSHMPVVATGDETVGLPVLDLAKHYFLTVLPKTEGSYTLGGAPIAPGQTSVNIFCNALPMPTAQISILVFEDKSPLNGSPDLPLNVAGAAGNELVLEGFKCFVEDAGGKYGVSGGTQQQDAFGSPIGTTYQRNPDGSALPGPVVDVLGQGFVFSGADGIARVRNLAPGKYGILCVPPAGEAWQQTTTIEGKKVIDAWVKANEPIFFTEFGPPGVHVFVGFVQPFVDAAILSGGETITGRVTNLHTARPPEVGFFSGPPVEHTTAWVALNLGVLGQGGGVFAGPANDDGTFSIPNLPPGDYQLVIFDKYLDFIMAKLPVNVAPAGGCNGNLDCAFGDIPVFQWFARLENWVFNDDGGGIPALAENGFWDSTEEAAVFEQAVNIRWRDGTINQSFPTDLTGFVPFDELFPFFAWLVAEIDFARFKATGLTVTVDAGGGPLDPLDPWSFGGQLNPQPQPDNAGLPYRTETGMVLTEAFQQFLGQTSVFQWGKTAYGPGENGGISGIVFYAITRAEDEPVFAAGEEWEPGIPSVTVNLYDETGTVLLQSTTTDSWDETPPTGCVWDGGVPFEFPAGTPHDCFDGLRNFNQARPGIFDGGYAFNDYYPAGCVDAACDPLLNGAPVALAAGDYVVEVVAPAGYSHLAEESRNVDFGDSYFPSTLSALLVGPADCVGPLHTVPAELELFPGVAAHNAGLSTPLCSKKRVWLSDGQNAASDFWLYTQAPISAHIYGFVLDDTANEFDAASPQFGEKFAPPWLPISIQDWRGREINRVYSDEFGVYNALVPSTYTANMPNPSGMSPAMHTVCINSPGTFDELGVWIADANFNPQYSQFCYTFQYMPGSTTYLDTPVVPIAAHAGPDAFPLDCEYQPGTPRIKQVVGGPWVAATGTSITIESDGMVAVPNPAYEGVGGLPPKTIMRDYGFGTLAGTATVGGVALTGVTWGDTSITGTVAAGTATGDLVVTRSDGTSTVTGVTVTVGGPAPVSVPTSPGAATIQEAIDNAAAGDLILVEPGQYDELVIMWKPVRLQGYGPGATVINAVKAPTEKLQLWRDQIALLINLGAVDLLPGQEILLTGLEPEVFVTEEGPGVMVLASDTTVGSGGYGLVGVEPNARIDGFTLTGGDTGGAIFVNGFAHHLEIANNRIVSNGGFYGGGIRVGHPFRVNAVTGDAYLQGANDNITIHHNHIAQNGGLGGAGGGVSLHTGTDAYQVTDNFICGNFTRGDGGGIGHLGHSDGGVIARNTILFNENFHDLSLVSGGGIAITGNAALGVDDPSDGAGSVRIEANLIQGNAAQVGDGGGIATERYNGLDVDSGDTDATGWHELTIVDNMIVNNLSGLAGGGIALSDTARASIHHNTIANNDSTATSGVAFTPGSPNQSNPQPAGVVSREHTPELAGRFGTGPAIDPLSEFSNPDLVDNIIWHNRSFFFNVDNTGPTPVYGLLPDVTVDPPAYDDLGVLGTALPEVLDPHFCILTDVTGTDNLTADPTFVSEYVNGDRGATIVTPEVTTGIQAPPAFDEGGNFIRLRFGPLTTADPATGIPFGNYHVQAVSPAIDAGLDLTGANPELTDDFDGDARPNGAGVDIGADEQPSAMLVLRTQPLPTGDQRKLRRRWRRQQRRQQRDGGDQVLPLGAMFNRFGPGTSYESGSDSERRDSKRLDRKKRSERKKRREAKRTGHGRRNGRRGVN